MSNDEDDGPLGYLFDELYRARRARSQNQRNSIEADVLRVLEKNKDKPIEMKDKDELERYGYAQQPIHTAAELGFAKVVQKLIDRGANINTTISMAGQTPVYSALQQGKIYTLKVLIENGAKTKGLDVYEYDLKRDVPALVSVLLCCPEYSKTTIAYYLQHIDHKEVEESSKILEGYYNKILKENHDELSSSKAINPYLYGKIMAAEQAVKAIDLILKKKSLPKKGGRRTRKNRH